MFRPKINRVYALTFLFSLHVAIAAYVNSSFLANFFPEKIVGLIFSLASILTLFMLSESSFILGKIGNRNFTLSLLYINMMALYGLAYAKSPGLIFVFFIAFFVTNSLIFYCIDIFLEHFESKSHVGKSRAITLFCINIAWLFSPLLAGAIITKAGYSSLYVFSFYVALFMAIVFLFSINKYSDKKYTRTPFFEAFHFLRKNRHIYAITMINFLLQFFYSVMVIYTPIYLHNHLLLSWENIGLIFTVMLAPFVLLGLPIGYAVDKLHFSKRNLLTFGIIIAGLSTLLMSVDHTNSILFFAIILFVTRIGATLIETTSEIYFFMHTREEDAFLLSTFRDMVPLSYVVGPLFGSAFLFFFPIEYIFIALGIIMLLGLFYIGRLRHNYLPGHLYKPVK